MPFAKPGKYVQAAKTFIGNAYSRGKTLATKIDDYTRKGMDVYQRSVPVLQALSDVSGGYGKGHLRQLKGGVYSGAKEYERLRSQVASRTQQVEQAAAAVGGAVESNFGRFL